jgi:uncharacterized protein
MKFLPQVLPIASFGDGGFRFGAMSHLGSLLVLPDGMRAWNPSTVLQAQDFAQIIEVKSQLDFVLLGTGIEMARPPRDVLAKFSAEGLNVDFMSTSSAVHTYNVMLAEGRRLAAAMVAVP